MANWDLSSTLGKYLDRHLVFPILEFYTHHNIYEREEILKARYDLSTDTMMLDYTIDVWRMLHGKSSPIPEAMLERRSQVLENILKCQKDFAPIQAAFDAVFAANSEKKQIETIRDGRTLYDILVKNYNFTPECVDAIYVFAKNRFECGDYSRCADNLYFCLLLHPQTDKNYLNFLWGRLACAILLRDWDTALDEFTRLKEYIDNNQFGSALIALQQRTWLIHWGLFVFFNHAKGQDLIIDMFLFQQQYLNAIQTTCPHILRYLTSAVITNKQRPSVMKELVKVIQQESYAYRDPITEFVECLYVNFDFDGAQKKLRECEDVLAADFFLTSCLTSFIENARLVIFETFCCIHQCISITMLAEKLNMSPEQAEEWIVNLIRNARLDAKIDSQLGHVVMSINTLSPYQQLIEKTKVLSFRAQLMASNVEKKLAANVPERIPYWATQEF